MSFTKRIEVRLIIRPSMACKSFLNSDFSMNVLQSMLHSVSCLFISFTLSELTSKRVGARSGARELATSLKPGALLEENCAALRVVVRGLSNTLLRVALLHDWPRIVRRPPKKAYNVAQEMLTGFARIGNRQTVKIRCIEHDGAAHGQAPVWYRSRGG